MWHVILDKDAFDSKKFDGLCVFRSKKIFVDSDLPGNEVGIIFMHELLHCTFPAGIVGDRVEERIVRKLSENLYKAMDDNNLLAPDEGQESAKRRKNTSKKQK